MHESITQTTITTGRQHFSYADLDAGEAIIQFTEHMDALSVPVNAECPKCDAKLIDTTCAVCGLEYPF